MRREDIMALPPGPKMNTMVRERLFGHVGVVHDYSASWYIEQVMDWAIRYPPPAIAVGDSEAWPRYVVSRGLDSWHASWEYDCSHVCSDYTLYRHDVWGVTPAIAVCRSALLQQAGLPGVKEVDNAATIERIVAWIARFEARQPAAAKTVRQEQPKTGAVNFKEFL